MIKISPRRLILLFLHDLLFKIQQVKITTISVILFMLKIERVKFELSPGIVFDGRKGDFDKAEDREQSLQRL